MTVLEAGDRIELVHMPDDPCPIEPGTTGTVRSVTEFLGRAQVSVEWDAPRSLSLCIPPDVVRVLSKESK